MRQLFNVSVLNKEKITPLAAIAEYFGQDQLDFDSFVTYSSNTKHKVILNNLITPNKGGPLFEDLPEYLKYNPKTKNKRKFVKRNRSVLWTEVSKREKRSDAQYARVLEVLLPSMLKRQEVRVAIEKFATLLTEEGMIVDYAVHNNAKYASFKEIALISNLPEVDKKFVSARPYAAFLLCTLRPYENGEFVNKNRDWNTKEALDKWKKTWFMILNETIQNGQYLSNDEKNLWGKKLCGYIEENNNSHEKVLVSSTKNKF